MAKYLQLNTDGSLGEVQPVQVSSGGTDANKVPQTDSGGKLDISLMPTGVGADTLTVTASEALSAGDFVNIHYSGGQKVRKAIAVDNTKPAHGFVLAAVSNGGSALVYFRGLNNMIPVGSIVNSDIGKPAFLSGITAGGMVIVRPNTPTQISQILGDIENVGATVTVNFSRQNFTVLA